jgi:citronellol/citronellal dehydrogenase
VSDGRVAIVTGASRGIGAGIARRLAAEGVAVACLARTLDEGDSHLRGSLASTVERIEAAGGRGSAHVVDLAADDLDAAGLVAAVEAELGPVTYLVNNAAACFYIPYADIPAKRIDLSYRVNVRSPWLLAQAVLPGMLERGRGSILNISSATSQLPQGPPFADRGIGGASAYGGSKAWLERATVGAAVELAGTGVSANTLAPEYAVITEGADAMMGAELEARTDIVLEPLATMAEAALALLTGDPDVLTGKVAHSLSLLRALDRPVRDLDGVTLVEGWQPADLPVDRLRTP